MVEATHEVLVEWDAEQDEIFLVWKNLKTGERALLETKIDYDDALQIESVLSSGVLHPAVMKGRE